MDGRETFRNLSNNIKYILLYKNIMHLAIVDRVHQEKALTITPTELPKYVIQI
jgi:uncharacterized protein YdhG (YjbR/CyaY superfamily)